MIRNLKELIGHYPALYGIEKTEEYKSDFAYERKKLDREWRRIDCAAKKLYPKLEGRDNHSINDRVLAGTLKGIKEKELSKIGYQIETKVRLARNVRIIGDLIDSMQASLESSEAKPMHVIRHIKYLREWESWSFGAGEDHGRDLEYRNEFAQALDMNLQGEYVRLSIAGSIRLKRDNPLLVIRAVNLFPLEEKRYWGEEELDYFKRLPLASKDDFEAVKIEQKWGPRIGNFYLETRVRAEEFFDGKKLVEPWKVKTTDEICRPYSTYEEGYIQFLNGINEIARVVNNQVGKVQHYTTNESKVAYGKDGLQTEREEGKGRILR